MACSGASGEACGGPNRLSVYERSGPPLTTVPILSGLVVVVILILLAHAFCPLAFLRRVEGRITALKAVQMNVGGETLLTQVLSTAPNVSIYIQIISD
jgi:hypothetical protein